MVCSTMILVVQGSKFDLWSISPSFYELLFRNQVSSAAFCTYTLVLYSFGATALIMLVKLTPTDYANICSNIFFDVHCKLSTAELLVNSEHKGPWIKFNTQQQHKISGIKPNLTNNYEPSSLPSHTT